MPEFAEKYPALAAKKGIEVAQEAGLPGNDAKAVVTAMHSSVFPDRVSTSAERRTDRAMARISRGGTAAPIGNFVPGAQDTSAAIAGGYQAKATAMQDTRLRSGVVLDALNQENNKLADLVDFDKEAYTARRLQELQPTADIDKAILDLRNRALFSQASMFDEVSNLPFNLQQQAIAARMAVFTDQIDDLSTLRQSRLDAAKNQITDEVGTYNGRIAASRARIEGLNTALGVLKDMGMSDADMAQLQIDFARENDKLQKARAGGAGLITPEELIESALAEKYRIDNGEAPSGADLTAIRQRARIAARTRPDIVAAASKNGGRYVPSVTTDSGQVGRGFFMTQGENPINSIALKGDPNTENSRLLKIRTDAKKALDEGAITKTEYNQITGQ